MPQHDVVVVGAGLAGLTAARQLHRAGLDVLVVERGDGVGGRVRTDRVDGMLLDRGFQLLNPAYPRVATDLDLGALQLGCFQAGAAVAHDSGRIVVADPRRSPRDVLSTATMPFGNWREKASFVRWALEIGYGPAARIKSRPDLRFVDELERRRLRGPLVESVLQPFLAGVLADGQLTTSRRLVELIARSFIRGTPGVPSRGMQAIPEQLAATLPIEAIRPNTKATAISPGAVTTDVGRFEAAAVVVATEAPAAARLLDRVVPAMRALTTYYHVAESSPAGRPLLHLDADRRGPVVNTAVMTDVVPGYAPGRALIASTILGSDDSTECEREVRRHAGVIYGTDASRWEHVATYPITNALPDTAPGTPLRRPVRVGDGVYVAGDHRDTASIQGALVSGHRVAGAVLDDLHRR